MGWSHYWLKFKAFGRVEEADESVRRMQLNVQVARAGQSLWVVESHFEGLATHIELSLFQTHCHTPLLADSSARRGGLGVSGNPPNLSCSHPL